METPQNKKIRPQRTPTPKMSARKKALFERDRQSPIRESENESFFMGIAPLSPDTKENIIEDCMRKHAEIRLQKSTKNLENWNLPLKNFQKLDSNIIDKNNSPRTRSRKIDFLDGSPRRSPRIRTVKNTSAATQSPSNTKLNSQENTPNTPKTFTPSTDELQVLFNNTLNFKQKKEGRNIFDENSLSSSDEETYKEKQKEVEQLYSNISHKVTKKRANSKEIDSEPSEKIPRIAVTPPNPSTIYSPIRALTTSIPTKSFYSRISATLSPQSSSISSSFTKHFKSRRHISFKNHSKLSTGINKGVRHKIRRNTKKKCLKKTSVEDILKTIRSDKFKFLPSKRVFDEKLKEVHEILNSSDDPIKRARPLNIKPNDSVLDVAFSDSEREEDCSSDNEIVPIVQEHAEVNEDLKALTSKRKFFKSGSHVIKNQYKLTNNIKATVTNGKLSILPSKKKKRSSKTKSTDESFSMEQRAIDDIIQKLDAVTDESFLGDAKTVVEENESIFKIDARPSQQTDVDEFANFRARIPYNTSDPEMIEQQQLLLDFLIANQICTEENFKIFITDPENHKAEAAQIVDSLIVVVPEKDGPMNDIVEHYEEVMTTTEDEFEQFRNMLPYNTVDPDEAERQKNILDFLISNQICTEENFKIFIADPDGHKEEAALVIDNLVKVISGDDYSNEQMISSNTNSDLRMDVEETTFGLIETLQNENIEPNRNSQPKDSSSAKLFPIFYPGKIKPIIHQSSRKQQNRWNRGVGANQYQIDAGQKEFGAKQCSKCGLVYTVHEPEEEKLHHEYHSNSHILKFKGWIDEDVVMEFPEWGSDGRIVKITNSAHPKRRERVAEVLKLVDQELGFSSYILPANYVVFFAIRRQHIVGFCLVQPLEKANRYVCSNGVDCCTEEVYPAKCGISRIWVAPFHRRLRIASKLIKAAQLHTIIGEHISIDKIAFSAPTDNGKVFAQAISKRIDFLVYQ